MPSPRPELFALSKKSGGPGRFAALGLLFLAFVAVPARASRPAASPSPSPLVSPQPSVAPEPLGADEARTLSKEFIRAQRTQLKASEHRQEFELKELSLSHKARIREWDTKEKALRRAFFKEHTRGPERRTYVQDFLARRKAFRAALAEERAAKLKQQEIQRKVLKEDQSAKLKEFDETLKRGQRPPERLWPQPGA